MTIAALPVISVREEGASLYISLPWGYPSVHASFVSRFEGHRREYKPALKAYRLPRERGPALRAWLDGQQGCEVRWERQDG